MLFRSRKPLMGLTALTINEIRPCSKPARRRPEPPPRTGSLPPRSILPEAGVSAAEAAGPRRSRRKPVRFRQKRPSARSPIKAPWPHSPITWNTMSRTRFRVSHSTRVKFCQGPTVIFPSTKGTVIKGERSAALMWEDPLSSCQVSWCQ